jgi:hypothetical protein
MFYEHKCGCIFSRQQGRVRICPTHRLESADGRGGLLSSVLKGKAKLYPANGEMVRNWGGR